MMLEILGWCSNARVLAARHSRRLRRALIADLATYAYRFPLNSQPNLDEDAPGEFYLFCHDKLLAMIDQFEDRGIPFEHYLNSVLRWQLRSFLRERKRHERLWQTVQLCQRWSSAAEALAHRQYELDPDLARPAPVPFHYVSSRTPALRLADPPRASAAARAPRARRSRSSRFQLPKHPIQKRMLFVLLKTVHILDEHQFAILVAATGCHPDSLTRLFRRMERRMEPSRIRQQMLRDRRNEAFAQCQFWTAAAFLETDPPKRARAQRLLARRRATLLKAQDELARVRSAPSNRIIADVLGLPKGTVDTGLSFLRNPMPARYLRRDGVGPGEQQFP